MPDTVQTELKSATEVTRLAPTQYAPNGIRYASYGDTQLSGADIEQVVQAVPRTMAAALHHKAYYFVPLTLGESTDPDALETPLDDVDPDRIMIASEFTSSLGDAAVCHRNATVDGAECIFVSTRLMRDRFALAFELYINVGHHFVDAVGVPETFMSLVWSQAEAGVRGETSQDAWELRGRAVGQTAMEQTTSRSSTPLTRPRRTRPVQGGGMQTASIQRSAVDEKARTEYFNAAFADAIAIYLLSLTVDFDYAELREREYPLLAAPALSERLRHVAQLLPPNAGQEFSIRHRRQA